MNIEKRIADIIEYTQLTQMEFANIIEVSTSNISHVLNGRNKPSLEFIAKIKNKFPELSWDWIILGHGKMLEKKNEASMTQDTESLNSTLLHVPDLFSSVVENEGFEEKPLPETVNRLENMIPEKKPVKSDISYSGQLGEKEEKLPENPIKRIVLFYENGRFESFEP